MHKGYLCLVLHGHLPFVRHPEHEDFLEEDWLYEAITETYIPLIWVFEGLVKDNVDFRLTLTLSPTLISMLGDPLLQERYIKHINKLIELSNKEIERTRFQPAFHETALHYYWEFTRAKDTFQNRYLRDITQAFRKFQDHGHLEIITCAATHGFLPLISRNEGTVRGQIKTATELYEKVLGRRPIGI